MEKYIFGENILFVQAVAQCFLKEKLPQNKPFYAKNAKMAGKGQFQIVGTKNQNENYEKASNVYLCK